MDHLRDSVVLNYRLVEKLGEGGFGAVFRARHEDLGREVAIKVLRSDRASHPGVVERFLREARIICDIGHPAIVEIENAGRLPTGEPFYVMELVPGLSLAQHLVAHGPLTPRDAIAIFAPLAEALAAAHAKGIIHRDFKPHNVMVVKRGGVIVAARLLDFGIAKLLTAGDASSTGEVMGSPHFMAPEQALDSKRATAAADVYSFGASLFIALTGRRPFDGASVPAVLLAVQQQPAPRLAQFARHAPPELDDVLDRCLQKEPEARPASIAEAWQALRDALAITDDLGVNPPDPQAPDVYTRTVTAASTSSSTAVGRGELSLGPTPAVTPLVPRRSRWPLALGGVVAVGVAVALAVMATRRPSSARPLAAITVDAGESHALPPPPAPPDAGDAADAAEPPPAPVDAAESPTDAAPAPADRRDAGRSRPHRHTTPTPPVPTPILPIRPAGPSVTCTRSSFAEVYQAAYPTPEQIRGALGRLRTCKAAGVVSETEYTSIQSALVARM